MSERSNPDYYADLEIHPGASQSDVELAARRQLFRWHPDRNPGRGEEARQRFLRVREAFEVLGDPARRVLYDRSAGLAGAPAREASGSARFERTVREAARSVADRIRQAEAHGNSARGLAGAMERLAAEDRGRPHVTRGRFYGFGLLFAFSLAVQVLVSGTFFEGWPVLIAWVFAGVAALLFLRTGLDALLQRARRERYREMAEILVRRRAR